MNGLMQTVKCIPNTSHLFMCDQRQNVFSFFKQGAGFIWLETAGTER